MTLLRFSGWTQSSKGTLMARTLNSRAQWASRKPTCSVRATRTLFYFNDEKIGKTRVKFKTLAPVWNQRFSIPKPDPRTYNTVRIEVYDYDRFSADDFMGQVVLTGKGLTAFPTVYTDLPLEKTVLVEKPYTENPELLGKEQDKEFARWEKDTKREKKQWERHNELVQGELTLRLFDASDVRKWQDQGTSSCRALNATSWSTQFPPGMRRFGRVRCTLRHNTRLS